jgi:hypothetical protein
LGVVIVNRTPIFLLAKNAFFRGNVGFVGAFMLVSAFLGYTDGRGEHEIMLDLLMGLFLGFMAVRAYGTESKMYKYIWGEAYYKMKKNCSVTRHPFQRRKLRFTGSIMRSNII